MKKKILVFYSNTGSGHLRAAEALKEEMKLIYPQCSVILYDGLEKGLFNITAQPSKVYSLVSLRLEPTYNLLYALTNNKLGARALKFLARSTIGHNLKKVIENEKPDLVISTHGLLSKSSVKKPYPTTPFITVITDLGKPHQVWFDKNSEKNITPIPVLTSTATPDSKTISIDYPLSSKFNKSRSGSKTNNTILILGGGTGAGNLDTQIKSLIGKIDKKMIVVCGRNEKLFEKLNKLYKDNDQIKLYGFADNLPELYHKSDIILTKAGPGTIVEAAALSKPLIITSWVGLQEKENIDFVLENNLGIYEPDPKKLPVAVNKVYEYYSDYVKNKDLFSKGARSVAIYINQEFLIEDS